MGRQFKIPVLDFVCEQPPDPFEEEFPLIGRYIMIRHNDEEFDITAVYVPEDDQWLYREEALQFIMRMAPIAKFVGGTEVTLTLPEEGLR